MATTPDTLVRDAEAALESARAAEKFTATHPGLPIVRYDRHHAAFKLHVADTVLAVAEAELAALREQHTVALAAAKAAGYRLAADNAAEQHTRNGADTEMLVLVLQRVAELNERAAADPTT